MATKPTHKPCQHELTFYATCGHAFKLITHQATCTPASAAQLALIQTESMPVDRLTEVGGVPIPCTACGGSHARAQCAQWVVVLHYFERSCEICSAEPRSSVNATFLDDYGVPVYSQRQIEEKGVAWQEKMA